MTRFDVDPYRCRHMASLGHNELKVFKPLLPDKRGGTFSELLAKLGELTGNREFASEARRLRFGPGRR